MDDPHDHPPGDEPDDGPPMPPQTELEAILDASENEILTVNVADLYFSGKLPNFERIVCCSIASIAAAALIATDRSGNE